MSFQERISGFGHTSESQRLYNPHRRYQTGNVPLNAKIQDQNVRFGAFNIDSNAIAFGSGLLVGCLIGTSGIVIISVLIACYYFRDTIAENLLRRTDQEINQRPSSGGNLVCQHIDTSVSRTQGLLTTILGWISTARL